jgi:hypothetical protein
MEKYQIKKSNSKKVFFVQKTCKKIEVEEAKSLRILKIKNIRVKFFGLEKNDLKKIKI